MRNKRRGRQWLVVILSVLILALIFLIIQSVNHAKTSHVKNVSKTEQIITQNGFVQQNSPTMNELTGAKKKKLANINKKMSDNRHFGAYLGIVGDTPVFAGRNGYANRDKQVRFKSSSTFLSGRYQEFLNNAIIIKLISEKKLSLSEKLTKYVPNNDETLKGITIKQLLTQKPKYYATVKNLNTLDADKYSSPDKLNVTTKATKINVSATSAIKAVLISKVLKKSYTSVVNKMLVDELGLSSLRINDNKHGYINDVLSYNEQLVGGVPSQTSVLKVKNIYFGTNQLRLSLSDIGASYRKILTNKYFPKSYQSLFLLSAKQLIFKKYDDSAFFYTADNNQSLIAQYNYKKDSLVVVGDNYPNGRLNIRQLEFQLNSLIK
ncbi:hypothetical protein ACWWTD_04775 [Lactiplantibacillus plantarum]|uniref:serine hydrolase n=1 Tax=Lactiplantibacillus plantarum TaxID=1590 RepID=UPI0010C4019F|nr:serine hydrolase [Lactiplantibacillus plantarum]QBZ21984.1 hypothetical protein D9752_10495 [Lactiplantibacillus plantarum]UQB60331.1 serine hydrolase [Lactiplantibacillus plantarum]